MHVGCVGELLCKLVEILFRPEETQAVAEYLIECQHLYILSFILGAELCDQVLEKSRERLAECQDGDALSGIPLG